MNVADARHVLAQSADMTPVEGAVDIDVPIEVTWECFRHAAWWPRWNGSFWWVRNDVLVAGRRLIWAFQPIKPWYLYKMPAVAQVVEVAQPGGATWHVTALPGFFARHSYRLEDLGQGRTRFSSWEKAMGPTFRGTRRFWVAHFRFVCDLSLEGARRLEDVYRREGRLDRSTLPRRPR